MLLFLKLVYFLVNWYFMVL